MWLRAIKWDRLAIEVKKLRIHFLCIPLRLSVAMCHSYN